MATPKQYQAQQMSMDWNANANRIKDYNSQLFGEMMKGYERVADKAAGETAKQRASDETRSLYDANSRVNSSVAGAQGQIGAASENSRAAIMAQELERDKFNINKNATMGLDAMGNVQNRSVDGEGGRRGSFSSGGVGMFGEYGVSALQTTGNMGDGARNYQNMKDYSDQRNQAYATTQMMGRAKASGDIARMQAQAKINSQQAALQRNADAAARGYESGEKEKDRANQRYLAGVDANSRLFASLNQGQGGFQYWGGSI